MFTAHMLFEMVEKNKIDVSKLTILFGQIVLLVNGVHTIGSDRIEVQKELFYLKNFNTSNIVNGILTYNWTQNQEECLKELNAIKIGVENREEWAIKGRMNFEFRKVIEFNELNRIH